MNNPINAVIGILISLLLLAIIIDLFTYGI